MMTREDRTIPDALDVLHAVRDTGLRHIGFKDVGVTAERQCEVVAAARDAGMTTYLELVSGTKDDELAAVAAAVDAGVDWILGGTFAYDIAERLNGTAMKFAPFPGRIIGHPSVLAGTRDEIVAHARSLLAVPGTHGLDLLAYRHESLDPLELTRAVVESTGAQVVVAGSVTTRDQVVELAKAGVWGFTIGSAVFDAALPGEADVASQVSSALRFAHDASVSVARRAG